MWWILVYLFLTAIVGLTLLVVFFLTWSNRYWKVRGFPDLPPNFFWKSFFRQVFGTKSNGDMDMDIYKHFSGKKFGGYVEFVLPVLWVTDPDLIRSITVKDFDHFVDRFNFDFGKKAEYINLMVSNLSGQLWKDVRKVMTPTFTSGKMKKIFGSIRECGENMNTYLAKRIEVGEEIEMKDAYGRFTMEVISRTAFGLKSDCFDDPDAIFLRMANKIMNPGTITFILIILTFLCPRLMKLLRMFLPTTNADPLDFFAKVVKDTIAEREKSGFKGKDFLQLLLDAKKGELQEEMESDKFLGYDAMSDEKSVEERKALSKAVLTEPLLIAQSIIFFVAGFETTANALGFAAYELALNPDIQEKLFEEVKEVLEKHDGQVTYDSLMEMEYLDKVIHETLRMHPPSPRMMRTCTKDYQIPGTDLTINKGTVIIFPTFALHRDERYFPNPKKFDPERFSSEEKAKRNPYVYQPFGHGPRNCLGMRFALMEAKAALAMTVVNFRFHPSKNTAIPMKYALPTNMMRAKNGVWLRMEKRNP